MDGNRAHMTSDVDVERTLLRLRRLWQSLLRKDESSLFVERKLCRRRLVRFLTSNLCHPCDRVRHAALELLCGATPRLGDKTDDLLGGMVVVGERLLGRNAPMEGKMKVFHFLRSYARRTHDLENFLHTFRRLGLESPSDAVQLSSIYGLCIVLDEDVGDNLFRIIFPSLVGALLHQDSRTLLRAAYRTLRRIHDLIGDTRFFDLMQEFGHEAYNIYASLLDFEENDPYLNIDLADSAALIGEYLEKMASIGLQKAFEVVDVRLVERIAAPKDSQKAVEVREFVSALKMAHWDELTIERHILDLVKLSTAFLADCGRPEQFAGLDILKELDERAGFYLGPHLTNLSDVLRETISSPNTQVTIKARQVVHKMMGAVHPQTVMWELLRGWEPRHKAPVLRVIEGELRCFPYYNFDLAALCATLANESEDADPDVRSASRDCVRLLLNIIRTSPVPTEEDQVVRLLMRNQAVNRETLMSVGISGMANKFLDDSFMSECNSSAPSTAQSTTFSKSTLVPDSSFNYLSRRFQDTSADQFERESIATSDMFVPKTLSNSKSTRPSVYSSSHGVPITPSESLYGKTPTSERNAIESKKRTSANTSIRKAYSSIDEANIKSQYGRTLVTRNCDSAPNFPNLENDREVLDEDLVKKRNLEKKVSPRLKTSDTEEKDLVLPSPVIPKKNADDLLTTSSNKWKKAPSYFHDGGDSSQKEECVSFHDIRSGNEKIDAKCERGDCNDFSAEDQHLSGSNYTLVTALSYDTEERTMVDISSGYQVQRLDPNQYNFNILRTSTPFTEGSIKELGEYEASESGDLEVVTPTWINAPYDDEAGEGPTKSKQSLNDQNLNHNQSAYEKETRMNYNNLDKNITLQECTNGKKDNFQDHIQVEKRASSRKISKSDSIPLLLNNVSGSSPYKPDRLPKKKTYKDSMTIEDMQLTSKVKHPCLPEVRKYKDEDISTNNSDKIKFNPLYYKIAYVSSDDEDHNVSDDLTEVNFEKDEEIIVADIDENNEEDKKDGICSESSTEQDAVNIAFFDENEEENVVIEALKRCTTLKSRDITAIQEDIPTVKPFLKKGNKKPSTLPPEGGWNKGREIPRTPENSNALQENELFNEHQEAKSSKKASVSKAKNIVTKKKTPSLLCKVDNPEPTSSRNEIEERKEDKIPFHFEEQFSKCPWRRDLEFANKGSTCAWVQAFEESAQQPFPSTEEAEKALKEALEDLEGKLWRPKEAALVVVVRVSLHHPSLLEEELWRVASALVSELNNLRQAVSGRAVVAAGLIYQGIGRKMENKLRVIVGALIKKSGNRTLSAHFQIVIKSLFRIVDSSNLQKVLMAFINEGSRHPNQASRETTAQFLCILTETLGAVGSLSGTMPGPVIKCAAQFATDRSALTRYCGKKMFQVLMKHPHFEKLKDHHLDVNTAQNLKTLLESIKEKGVEEEVLPINLIK